jgi:hypothetical protein
MIEEQEEELYSMKLGFTCKICDIVIRLGTSGKGFKV